MSDFFFTSEQAMEDRVERQVDAAKQSLSTITIVSVSQSFCDCLGDTCCQVVECCRHAGEACGPDCSGVAWQEPEDDEREY